MCVRIGDSAAGCRWQGDLSYAPCVSRPPSGTGGLLGDILFMQETEVQEEASSATCVPSFHLQHLQISCARSASKVVPRDPHLLAFTLSLEMGRTCDLLLTDRAQQRP